jgi:hypothetical protein
MACAMHRFASIDEFALLLSWLNIYSTLGASAVPRVNSILPALLVAESFFLEN